MATISQCHVCNASFKSIHHLSTSKQNNWVNPIKILFLCLKTGKRLLILIKKKLSDVHQDMNVPQFLVIECQILPIVNKYCLFRLLVKNDANMVPSLIPSRRSSLQQFQRRYFTWTYIPMWKLRRNRPTKVNTSVALKMSLMSGLCRYILFPTPQFRGFPWKRDIL